jgi:hypothetical protein
MDSRDLTKSILALPWTLSMFGIQQVANLVRPPSSEGLSGTAEALDSVSEAAEQQLDGWMKQTYKAGTNVQSAVVDMLMLRFPDLDSSAIMRMAAQMQSGALFQAIVKYGMPPVGWTSSLLVPRRDAPAVQQEFANKLYIISLVTQIHEQLGLDDKSNEPLTKLVEKVAVMETFPRLWATEGLGNYYGDRALERSGGFDPSALLTDAATAALPPWSLTMLHAGIGMSFAKDVLAKLEPTSSPMEVRAGIARFAALCRNSSRAGYAGAAIESLGLATRTLYPNLISLIDKEIPEVDPSIHGYFWHGAGRAMYFDPMNMLPPVNAPWRAIKRLDKEAPHPLAFKNALSGLAWAITVVNMRDPQVMETFLRHHADLAAANDGFTNGVTSSLMMRYDTTRDDAKIAPFVHYRPSDPAVANSWRTLITTPCEQALRVTYAELSQRRALEELFHYR